MPISKALFGRANLALLALGFLGLLVLAGGLLWMVQQARFAGERAMEMQSLRAGILEVLSLLQDAETGQRGYLLTGRSYYLDPYRHAGAALPVQLQVLAQRAPTAEPAERDALTTLQRAAGEKMTELARTIALHDGGDRAGALALVLTDQGKGAMDTARAQADAVLGGVEARLRESFGSLSRGGNRLLWLTGFATVLIAVMAAGSSLLATRYARDLEAAQAGLLDANARLERRVAERTADLTARSEELAAANQEVQRFAYIVSHDLRAPLVNVMGFTAELEASTGTLRALLEAAEVRAPDLVTAEARLAVREDLPEAIGFIRSSTERMDRLINAILRLSREGQRRLTPEPVKVGEMVEDIAATLRHQLAEQGGEIAVEPGVPDVTTDRLALEQVLGNLLDNAVKYLDPARPGRIRVRGSRGPTGTVVYSVEDNGRGIAAKDLERIWELFRRSGAQDRPGEGIGLAHVRALARRLGGTVTCRSEPGQGSVFSLTLPPSIAPDVAPGVRAA